MTWLVLSAAALFLAVAYGLISKKVLSDKVANLDPIAFASAMFVFVGVTTFILYLIRGVAPSDIDNLKNPSTALLLAVNLILYTLAPSLYYRALKNLPLSIITIIYSLSGFFALLIQTILGYKSFIFSGLLGSVLVILSVAIVSLKSAEIKFSRPLLLTLLATIIYALTAVIDTQLTVKFTLNFYLSVAFGICGLLILPINLIPWKKIIAPYRLIHYKTVILNGTFQAVSFFFIFRAYKAGGSAAQVYSLLALETVLTVLAAALFLSERRDLPLKISAGLIASLGVYLLAL